ncbi:MAG: PKD domain-containing protein, partial [Verrucomicrobia bacterium]|nr:PKD domain-containing protein [Verrucomicrobiota bacterium]
MITQNISGLRAIGFSAAVATSVLSAAVLLLLCFSIRADTFSYDSLGRLLQERFADGTTIDYVYDALGNRLMKATTLAGAPSNQPPAAVTNPSIATGTTNVPTASTLSWSPAVDPNSGDSVVYFIYFGTTPNPPLAFSGWTMNWSPGKLHGWTTYYWQVVARDSHNAQTPGPVRNFTTGNEPPVADFVASPTNGTTPFTVSFTDCSSDPDDAVVSWQWDFDNNVTLDSINRNPTFTYTNPGDYTVTLTVRDEAQAPTTITKSNLIHVVGSGIVDLSPLGLSVQSAGSYRHLTVVYSITNRGTVSLSGVWQWADACYISTNATLDTQSSQVGIFYETQTLPAGAVYFRTNVVTIPDVVAQNYYLILKADAQNQIGELSEANNIWAIPLAGILPDLSAGNLASSGTAVSGQSIQARYSVTNRGTLGLEAMWNDTFYFSSNAVWDAQDTTLASVSMNQALAAGASYSATNTLTLPRWPAGNYFLLLRADDNNYIVESNETNNSVAIPITITTPDLAAGSLHLVAPDGAGVSNWVGQA